MYVSLYVCVCMYLCMYVHVKRGQKGPACIEQTCHALGWLAGSRARNYDQGTCHALGWLAGCLWDGRLVEAQKGQRGPERPIEAERG